MPTTATEQEQLIQSKLKLIIKSIKESKNILERIHIIYNLFYLLNIDANPTIAMDIAQNANNITHLLFDADKFNIGYSFFLRKCPSITSHSLKRRIDFTFMIESFVKYDDSEICARDDFIGPFPISTYTYTTDAKKNNIIKVALFTRCTLSCAKSVLSSVLHVMGSLTSSRVHIVVSREDESCHTLESILRSREDVDYVRFCALRFEATGDNTIKTHLVAAILRGVYMYVFDAIQDAVNILANIDATKFSPARIPDIRNHIMKLAISGIDVFRLLDLARSFFVIKKEDQQDEHKSRYILNLINMYPHHGKSYQDVLHYILSGQRTITK